MRDRDQSAREFGFSLIELVVVIALIMIVSALAAPQIRGAMDNMRLRSMVTDVDGLVQQDRIQSVRDNKSYTLKQVAGDASNGITLFIDSDGDGLAGAGEPAIQLPTNVTVVNAGPGPLPPNVAVPPYITANTVTVSFNERGLPCSNPPVCRTIAPYVIYFSQTRASGVGWAAITVTQSGRIKAYTYTGASWQ